MLFRSLAAAPAVDMARAANEAVYMDDLLLAGANEVPMYSTAGESSEHVVVDPTTGSVYQASTFADSMGEYMNPDESGGTQAQDYMDVGNGDGTYQVLMDAVQRTACTPPWNRRWMD